MMRGGGIAMVLIAMTGCFAGYDSRWGQSAAVQRQHAASHTPTLRGEDPEKKETNKATLQTKQVRAYVSRAYTTQVSDVPGTLRELFADINDLMEPALGVTLVLEGIRQWDIAKDDELPAVLKELRQSDPASDVDWVAGFVGALPRATESFHDLGLGEIPGRYIALRAASSAQNHDALERAYRDLGEEERKALQKEHRRHKLAASFLHEIGHTLGAFHERSETTLMYPGYRTKMRSFGPETTAIMRSVLTKRDSKTTADQAALLRDIATGVRAAPNVFFEDERTKLLPQLEAKASELETLARSAARTDAPPREKAKDIEGPSELSADDQKRYISARELAAKGENVAAWELAKPLFSAYSDVLLVQDLRCSLATNVFRFEDARRECARLMELSTGRAPSKTR